MLKTLFRRCKQYQIVYKKQTVNPATSNSDTLVDSAVAIYPIHINYEERRWWKHTPLWSPTPMTRWPVTGGCRHQYFTLATLPKAFHEKRSHVLSHKIQKCGFIYPYKNDLMQIVLCTLISSAVINLASEKSAKHFLSSCILFFYQCALSAAILLEVFIL